ncbi:MAG: DNA polymerase I [Deltaproteobacteria bacterium]|nr:DNA polymerase I [Deltaproteobacteria bacterium]
MDTPLYLIDGSGYIFRAYYAIRNLSNSHGFPTNALYGFTQMLWKFLQTCRPTYAAVVFDAKEPSFREALFPAYKANRPEPPDDLVPQFPFFSQIVAGLGLPQFVQPGFEADDLIGTLARHATAAGHDVVIITGDKDFMQLVDDRVALWDTMRDKRTDAAGVRDRFGVTPAQVTDVLGLAGDAVDNVPGVAGIGEKTAIKLIQEWGDVEGVLAHATEIKGKLGERLQASGAAARLSKQLVTIRLDVPLTYSDAALRVAPSDTEQLRALFKQFEFTSLQKELAPHVSLERAGYQCLTEPAALAQWVERVRSVGQCALDTETTSLNPRHAGLVGISMAVAPGEAVYIPLRHQYLGVPPQLPLEAVVAMLGPVLRDAQVAKYLQNAKFDLPILARHGLPVAGVVCDTMIAAYLLNPGGPHGLDAMAQQYLDHTMITFRDVLASGEGERKDFTDVPLDDACRYAAEDADATWQLAIRFLPELEQEGLAWLFREVEMPLLHVLMAMETVGVAVDATKLAQLAKGLRERLSRVEAEIFSAAGEAFNIASPKQLGVILFEKLQLPGAKRTKTGYATHADVLERLAAQHPLPRLILEHRSLAKLLSTYLDALPKLIDPTTGRIHTSFNQTVAATGRLSSSDPNLQNIPIRSDEGRQIREAFVAAPNHVLLAADYSQIELRVLAHTCEDQRLVAAFAADRDVHAETAASLFGVAPDQVSSVQRMVGKTINFAVIYGQTAYGLAQQLGLAPAAAQQYIDQYFTQYPGVAAYREQVLADARHAGKVSTLYGRRRFLPELGSHNAAVRANAERMAFNTVIQGTAADIIKVAMVAIARRLPTACANARLLLQVHDELVFEVPQADLDCLIPVVRTAMEDVRLPSGAVWRVPLQVNLATGPNWGGIS